MDLRVFGRFLVLCSGLSDRSCFLIVVGRSLPVRLYTRYCSLSSEDDEVVEDSSCLNFDLRLFTDGMDTS